MKTRAEFWKEYRKQINNNIKLQKNANISDQKLTLLNKKLLGVFPDYDQKFKIKNESNDFFKEFSKIPYIKNSKINNLKIEIDEISDFPQISNAIDDMDFSSHELDYIIEKIKTRNNRTESDIWVLANGKDKQNNDLNQNNSQDQKIQVAIDGPSGSGKSTVARIIAQKYKLKHINTGLIYRAIAFNAWLKNVDLNNENDLFKSLPNQMIKLENNQQVFLKGKNITEKLRTDEMSSAASKISIHRKVRQWATNFLKNYASQNKIIMDGRDVTFNIMPHANIKIFLETSAQERAIRRTKENQERGIESDFDKILQEIIERDDRDQNRKINPLQKTKDAHLINATKLSIADVVNKISLIINKEIS